MGKDGIPAVAVRHSLVSRSFSVSSFSSLAFHVTTSGEYICVRGYMLGFVSVQGPFDGEDAPFCFSSSSPSPLPQVSPYCYICRSEWKSERDRLRKREGAGEGEAPPGPLSSFPSSHFHLSNPLLFEYISYQFMLNCKLLSLLVYSFVFPRFLHRFDLDACPFLLFCFTIS